MDLQSLKDILERVSKKEDNTNNTSDDGEGMDKVQPKALKKKFADRKDKDIDNDGDTDKSDEYLHNRRKTVSKAVSKDEAMHDDEEKGNGNGNGNDDADKMKVPMKKKKNDNGNGDANGKNDNEVEMNPKVDNMKKSESKKSTVESFRSKLLDVLEANQTPHKDKAEKPEDNLKGAGAKQMKKDVETGAQYDDSEEKGHDDASKAGRAGPNGKARPNDSKVGDKNVVNSVKKEELSPNASMKKLTDAFKMVLDKKED
jgi:hypothetical protein